MSARGEAFTKLCEFLEEHEAAFDAPYGVIEGSIPGKHSGSIVAYTVTFGCSRTWDATVTLYSEDRVVLSSRGHYTKLNGSYDSVDALTKALTNEFIRPF